MSCKTESIGFPCSRSQILEQEGCHDAQQCFPKCVLWHTSPVACTNKSQGSLRKIAINTLEESQCTYDKFCKIFTNNFLKYMQRDKFSFVELI